MINSTTISPLPTSPPMVVSNKRRATVALSSNLQHKPQKRQRKRQRQMIPLENECAPGTQTSTRYPVPRCLQVIIKSCQRFSSRRAIPPDHFLNVLLKSRGFLGCPDRYDPDFEFPTETLAISFAVCNKMQMYPPGSEQVMPPLLEHQHYIEMLRAVEASNISRLQELHMLGYRVDLSNAHGESLMHRACKAASCETVAYLLYHGARVDISDDHGRTPMHEACRRAEPDFDVVLLLHSMQPRLLVTPDKRGHTPLMYIGEEQWLEWCCFLYHHRNLFWPVRSSNSSSSNDDSC